MDERRLYMLLLRGLSMAVSLARGSGICIFPWPRHLSEIVYTCVFRLERRTRAATDLYATDCVTKTRMSDDHPDVHKFTQTFVHSSASRRRSASAVSIVLFSGSFVPLSLVGRLGGDEADNIVE